MQPMRKQGSKAPTPFTGIGLAEGEAPLFEVRECIRVLTRSPIGGTVEHGERAQPGTCIQGSENAGDADESCPELR